MPGVKIGIDRKLMRALSEEIAAIDKDAIKMLRRKNKEAAQIGVAAILKEAPYQDESHLYKKDRKSPSSHLRHPRTIRAIGARTSAAVKIGTKRVYWHWWVHRGHATGWGGYVPTNPYARRGVRKSFGKVREAFVEGLNEVIDTFNAKDATGSMREDRYPGLPNVLVQRRTGITHTRVPGTAIYRHTGG